MADSPEAGPVIKRKRVANACQTCRSMKAKCDGKQPICSRCEGYGYTCAYRPRQNQRGRPAHVDDNESRPSEAGQPQLASLSGLRDAIEQYEKLLERILPDLPTDTQVHAQAAHASIRDLADRNVAHVESSLVTQAKHLKLSNGSSRTSGQSQRYLGEVSDVRFFNLVKRVLQTKGPSEVVDHEFDSYEQDGDMSPSASTAYTGLSLPPREEVDHLVDIYFSTIHLAYPFVPESVFRSEYETMRSSPDGQEDSDQTWLALLYTICAIGAYYISFPANGSAVSNPHEMYFLRACLYFLAVCKTDSCWTTLGLAVRAAQSMGLHTENPQLEPVEGHELFEAEKRRRVWYSIYVLDRLLSLQLGRPPAIHDEDCHVALPSRAAAVDLDGHFVDALQPDRGPSTGDYFLAVIAFSRIVGQVLRDIYSPRKGHSTPPDLLSTKGLDKTLVDWKMGLPRTLRFDWGHAFEQTVAFKRQRNMLAVKYHHLRALIHRPYLYYPLLRSSDFASAALPQADWPLMGFFERTCISEARETARLLHNVSTEKDFVHDFPWWQMISCLICAGSILLVSSIFAKPNDETHADLDTADLYDNAETCLHVLDALSANSTGAKTAGDMLKCLKEHGLKWREAMGMALPTSHEPVDALASSSVHEANAPAAMHSLDGPDFDKHGASLSEGLMFTPGEWPAEFMDSMAWSSQFFLPVQEN